MSFLNSNVGCLLSFNLTLLLYSFSFLLLFFWSLRYRKGDMNKVFFDLLFWGFFLLFFSNFFFVIVGGLGVCNG